MSEQTCIIPLGKNGQFEAVVDEQDYPAVARWCWNFKLSSWKYGKNVYARRGGGKTGKFTATVLMHVYILETLMGAPRPSELHTVDHIDRNTLNNRRCNLRWATKSEQSKNQRRHQPAHDKKLAA